MRGHSYVCLREIDVISFCLKSAENMGHWGSVNFCTNANCKATFLKPTYETYISDNHFSTAYDLKGQCHEIFDIWFFSWISFPQTSEYTFTAISNIFENSRRYSVVELTYIYIFAFKFTLRCLQPDIVRWHWRQICRRYRWHPWQICHRCQQHKGNWWQNLPPVSLIPVANLPPVSLIPAAICHRCHWHRWQVCHGCRWHWWCTLTCEYLREFSKKFETVLMGHSGAEGKLIHKKTRSKKSRDTVPLSLDSSWFMKPWKITRCMLIQ